MDRVLVLLSSYNGEKYLDEQLDSLFAQEGVNVHVLVRDDGSSDKTVGIVRNRIERGDRITLLEGNNLGFAMSFMALIEEAYSYANKYDFYAFCDQDDVWLPKKLLSAVRMIREEGVHGKPNLYWSSFTLVDENLNPLRGLINREQESAVQQNEYKPKMTKPTILVRYFMLGCTMVFDRTMLMFLNNHKPQGKLTMHDLWLSQTAIFFGHVIYDNNSYLLYRQHGNNAAGVDNSWKGRLKRFKKSFETYERRHFREINAKNLLGAYQSVLCEEDFKLIDSVASYRTSFIKRISLLINKDITMGSFTSDLIIKLRILFGLL